MRGLQTVTAIGPAALGKTSVASRRSKRAPEPAFGVTGES